jgi:chemotaxis protein CheD
MRIFTIGVAEQRVASAPDKIVTLGLGSCIGLVLYDSVAKIGGMVHIMLPTAAAHSAVTNRFKFADTAIVDMIGLMVKAGASRARLRAKIAGGAHMFKTTGTIDIMNVGQRNIAMCHKILGENRIVLDGEDTGGSSGRSIEFCCESCTLSIRTVSPKAIRTI